MKYRKIHAIEAIQITEDHVLGLVPLPNSVRFIDRACHQEKRIIVRYRMELDSLEQQGVPVLIGNWVATGIKGEHWVIQDDVFRATYELAEPTDKDSFTVKPEAKVEPEREWRVVYETEIAGLGWREISDGNGMTEDNAEQSFQIHSARSPIGPGYRNVRKQWRTPAGPWQDCEAKG